VKTETLVAATVVFAGSMGLIMFAASKAEAAQPHPGPRPRPRPGPHPSPRPSPHPHPGPHPGPHPAPHPGPHPTPHPSGRTAKQAAQDLYEYALARVKANDRASLGTPAHRNELVHKAQVDMGGTKLSAALARGEGGIYGELTRERGKQLIGKVFPRAPSQHETPAHPSAPAHDAPITAHPVELLPEHHEAPPAPEHHAAPALPANKHALPEPAAPTHAAAPEHHAAPAVPAHVQHATAPTHAAAPATRTPKQAAQDLYDYATARVAAGQRDSLGTPDNRNELVHKAQVDMGGAQLSAALARGEGGIYGNLTRERGKALLGKTFPMGPAQHTSHATPAHAAAPAPSSASGRTPTQAARELYDYVTSLVRAGHRDQLGSTASRNETVHRAQIDMKGAKLSAALARGEGGIYGNLTRARGKELLGREFPA
jgi:hypothetical protein